MERFVLGIDVGGTFTDACAVGDAGTVIATKTSTTPREYGVGVMNSIEELAKLLDMTGPELLARSAYICHGTTSTLNALVIGDVAKVGFITTRGHKDSIAIMNIEGRYLGLDPDGLQDILRTRKPEPLVPAHLIREIDERVDLNGRVVVEPHPDAIRAAVTELIDAGVDAVAVSLLWSFMNPAHEQLVRSIIHESDPELYVGVSSEISARIGEYGRSTTTIMSAQVGPRLAAYLSALEDDLRSRDFGGRLLIMQGTGGVITASEAAVNAIVTVGSVLTGGVVGSVNLGKQLGHDNIIATDMGGTTFLVGLVIDGAPVKNSRALIGQHAVNLPMVQIHTIGSGGGAIAWVDSGDNLRVGPRSAQAVPGPAAYGRGGTEPTITDADLILGILDADSFLGGRMHLDLEAARAAMRTKVAEPLGMSVEDAAMAVFSVANAQIADAIRQVVVNNGHDPRDFVMYAYGGAAPVHCAMYARDIGVERVVIPLGTTASAFSAYGLAASDVVITTEQSSPANHPVPASDVNRIFDELERAAYAKINGQGLDLKGIEVRREIDIRFSLQMSEVPTPVKSGRLTNADLEDVTHDFQRTYERIYGTGTGFAAAGFQFITYRVYATGRLSDSTELPSIQRSTEGGAPDSKGERPVFLELGAGAENTLIYDYRALLEGHRIEGPALIEAPATTVVIPRGHTGVVDRLGNLVLEPSAKADSAPTSEALLSGSKQGA